MTFSESDRSLVSHLGKTLGSDNWSYLSTLLSEGLVDIKGIIHNMHLLSSIRDIYSCDQPHPGQILRSLWIDSNKEFSVLWNQTNSHRFSKLLGDLRISSQRGFWADEIDNALSSLKRDGIYVLQKKLPLEFIERIRYEMLCRDVVPSNSNQQMMHDKVRSADALYSANVCTDFLRWHFPRSVFEDIKPLSTLVSDISLHTIASEYLGFPARRVNNQAWLSLGKHNTTQDEASGAAQLFHFDYDSFNFLKVMVYVSDVCRECGPHCYIKHSHKEFPGSLRDVGINPYGRYTDAHMYGAYGPDAGIEVLGEAGTVILVDTSGFHKGKILSGNARRIMVQTEFIDTFTHFGK